MVVRHFTQGALVLFLESNGYSQEPDILDFMIFSKDGNEIMVQKKSVYFPRHIKKICDHNRLCIPPEIQRVTDQLDSIGGSSSE